MFRVKLSAVIICVQLLIISFVYTVVAESKASAMPLALKVEGNQILNSKGEPVTLRGVNTACLEWTSDGQGHILETVRVAIEDWHVNIIRLPLSQDRWFGKAPEQDDEGKAYRGLVKEIVDMCSSKGCYIILDLHWSNAGKWGENIGQHSMPDKNSVTFWKDIAAVYANHPAVIFDLYNEPFGVTWDVWLNGGTIKDRPWRGRPAIAYEAVGMQELLDTVRSTSAKNVVIAGGLDWAYDFSGILEGRQLKDPDGNGVIYANHAYDNKRDSVNTWIANMEKAAAKLPVIVSEFGGSGGPNRRRGWWGSSPATAMGDDWLLHVMQALDDHNWSWVAWDLHPTAGPTLISDWDYTPTEDFGVFIKQALVGELPRYTPPDFSKLAKELASALPASARFGTEQLYGDWKIEPAPGERRWMESILSFSSDKEGKLAGQWINFRGISELEDIRFNDNKLSFIQVVRFDQDKFIANFIGTVEDDKLSGTLSHGGSQSELEAKRMQRIPPAVGNWEMKYKMDGHKITSTLIVKTDQEDNLTAEWQSQSGEHEITDVKYEQGKLTFKRKSKIGDSQSESFFEGTIRQDTDTLFGMFKSERGEIAAEGKLIGSAIVGDWIFDVNSDWGDYEQRLRVNPDLSGMYGTTPIEKVNLEGDKVTFKIVLHFGPRTFEINFEGKLRDSQLTGEMTTFGGIQKMQGTKVIRTPERCN